MCPTYITTTQEKKYVKLFVLNTILKTSDRKLYFFTLPLKLGRIKVATLLKTGKCQKCQRSVLSFGYMSSCNHTQQCFIL